MVLELNVIRRKQSTIVTLNGVRIASVTRSGLVRRYQQVIKHATVLREVIEGTSADRILVTAKDSQNGLELYCQGQHLFDLVETTDGWSIRFGGKQCNLLRRESQAIDHTVRLLRALPDMVNLALNDNMPVDHHTN